MVCHSPQLRKESQRPLCSLSWQVLLHQFAVEEMSCKSDTEQTNAPSSTEMLYKNIASSIRAGFVLQDATDIQIDHKI